LYELVRVTGSGWPVGCPAGPVVQTWFTHGLLLPQFASAVFIPAV
jgi:hypothetical protein